MSVQPLINRKATIRFAIGLFVIAGLIFVYSQMNKRGEDIDQGTANTVGWIAALKNTGHGTQLVTIDASGKVTESPGYSPDARDRQIAWRPDGNRIFFSSDRVSNPNDQPTFNIYRWNLATNALMKRTLGKIPKEDPVFAWVDSGEEAVQPLVCVGGSVWKLDPATSERVQIFPAATDKAGVVQDKEGSEDPSGLGSATNAKIRQALFFKGKRWLAVIRDTDDGQVLMAVDTTSNKPAFALGAADHISMAVSSTTGALGFCLQGFQFSDKEHIPPQFVQKDGTLKMPFKHLVAVFDPEKGPQPDFVIVSNDEKFAFTQPAFSADGSEIAVCVGSNEGNGMVSTSDLISMPAVARGGDKAHRIMKGEVGSPTFSPDGKSVAFSVVEGGKHVIYVSNTVGKPNPVRLTTDGDYTMPSYSPQKG